MKYFSGGKCKKEYLKSLKGKTVLVTGGNTGLGFEYCRQCVKNAVGKLIVCARNKTKGEKTIQLLTDLKRKLGMKTELEYRCIDLGSFKSIELFANQLNDDISKGLNIDVYCCNAGCMNVYPQLTVDGLEIMFGVNHMGHFYLTKLLEKSMLKFQDHVKERRVVVVSSGASFLGVKGTEGRIELDIEKLFTKQEHLGSMKKYGRSKMCNLLFAQELHKRFSENPVKGKELICCSLHPGMILTTLGQRKMPWWGGPLVAILKHSIGIFFAKNESQGIQTHLFLSSCPISKLKGGMYYEDCKIGRSDEFTRNPKHAKELWKVSEVVVNEIKKGKTSRK